MLGDSVGIVRSARRGLAAAAVALLALGSATAAIGDPGEHAYRAAGSAVEGGGSIAAATALAPGIYRDSFAQGAGEDGDGGTVKHYRVEAEEGQRVHAAATIAAPVVPDGLPPDAEELGVEIELLTADDRSCDASSQEGIGESYTGDGPVTAFAVSAEVGSEDCAGREVFVRVERDGTRAAEQALEVEIQVAIEPADAGAGSPTAAEPIETDGASPVAPDDPEPIALGRSLADPEPVDPGSYVVELEPGDVGVLAIDVRQGQRLLWRTETTGAPEGDPGEVALRVHNPVRGVVPVDAGSWSIDGSQDVHGGGMVAPVSPGNRANDEVSDVADTWLPGTQLVMVHRLQRDADADPAGDAPTRMILTLEVEGEAAGDASDTVLDLGDAPGTGGSWGIGRILLVAGAVASGLVAVATGVAGVVLLRRRAV